MKPNIFITRKMPEKFVEQLQRYYDVTMWESESEAVPREVLLEKVKKADALWTVISDSIDREVLTAAPKLKIIANMAVGYNNIDIEAAKQFGVLVTNTPDVLTNTTADLAFALLLSTARNLSQAERQLRDGKWTSWEPLGFTGVDVHQATLGIIGMGRIGEAVARRAKGFDMKVLYYNRNRKLEAERSFGFEYAAFDNLLANSDFIVLLVPYTSETAGLIGKEELAKMKKTATLINVARGGVVDEQALYDALKSGSIRAAGLDVFEKEPVPLDHPLLTLSNVTVLPHIGSASIATREAMMRLNVEAFIAVAEKREPNHRVV